MSNPLGDMVVKISSNIAEFSKDIDVAKNRFTGLQSLIYKDGQAIGQTLKNIDNYAVVFGDTTEANRLKQEALKQEIINLINQGFKPESAEIQNLKVQYDALNKKLDETKDKKKDLAKTLNSLATTAAWAGGILTAAITVPLVKLGKTALESAGDFQLYNVAFETMLGDAEKATEMITALQEMAAKTPFLFTDLSEASKLLLQYGVAAKDIMPTVQTLGDIAQGNSQRFQSLALAYSQTQSAGKLMGQDLLQMINAGFNPLQEIAKQTGKSVGDLREEMERGGISAKLVADAFKAAASEGGKFYQGMEKASQTLPGLLMTLKDDALALGRSFANVVMPSILEFVRGLSNTFKSLMSLDEGTKTFIITMGAFAASLGPVLLALSGIAKIVATFIANPIVGIIAAVTAGVILLTGAIVGLKKAADVKFLEEGMQEVNNKLRLAVVSGENVVSAISRIARETGLAVSKVAELAKEQGLVADNISIQVDALVEANEELDKGKENALEQLKINEKILKDQSLLHAVESNLTDLIKSRAESYNTTEDRIISVLLSSDKLTDTLREQLVEYQSIISAVDTRQQQEELLLEKAYLRTKAIKDQAEIQKEIDDKEAYRTKVAAEMAAKNISERIAADNVYYKDLDQLSIKRTAGLLTEVEYLEEQKSVAERYLDTLLDIGYTGELHLNTWPKIVSSEEEAIEEAAKYNKTVEIGGQKFQQSASYVKQADKEWKVIISSIQEGDIQANNLIKTILALVKAIEAVENAEDDSAKSRKENLSQAQKDIDSEIKARKEAYDEWKLLNMSEEEQFLASTEEKRKAFIDATGDYVGANKWAEDEITKYRKEKQEEEDKDRADAYADLKADVEDSVAFVKTATDSIGKIFEGGTANVVENASNAVGSILESFNPLLGAVFNLFASISKYQNQGLKDFTEVTMEETKEILDFEDKILNNSIKNEKTLYDKRIKLIDDWVDRELEARGLVEEADRDLLNTRIENIDEQLQRELYANNLLSKNELESYYKSGLMTEEQASNYLSRLSHSAAERIQLEKKAQDDIEALQEEADAHDAARQAIIDEANRRREAEEAAHNERMMQFEVDQARLQKEIALVQAKMNKESALSKTWNFFDWLNGNKEYDRVASLYDSLITSIEGLSIPGAANGAIAMPTSGGQIVRVAEAGVPEVISPLDKLGDVLNQYMGSSGSRNEVPIQLVVNIDDKPILDKIFQATRDKRVLISNKAIVYR